MGKHRVGLRVYLYTVAIRIRKVPSLAANQTPVIQPTDYSWLQNMYNKIEYTAIH
jgi:hypothetical protein